MYIVHIKITLHIQILVYCKTYSYPLDYGPTQNVCPHSTQHKTIDDIFWNHAEVRLPVFNGAWSVMKAANPSFKTQRRQKGLESSNFLKEQVLRVPCCISSPKILDYWFNIPPKSKWPVAQRLIQQRRKWHSTHNMTAFSGVLAWKLWLFRLKIFTQTSINCGRYSSILQMAAPITDQSL